MFYTNRQRLNVDSEILEKLKDKVLPMWYDAQDFADDVLALFQWNWQYIASTPVKHTPRPLRGQKLVAEFIKAVEAVYPIDAAELRASLPRLPRKPVVEEFAMFHRMFSLLSKEPLRTRYLKPFADAAGNPYDAARLFLLWLVEDGWGGGGGDGPGGLPLRPGGPGGLPILPKRGRSAGRGHFDWKKAADAMRMLRVAKKLSLLLQWAKEYGVRKLTTLWPEDDIEPRTMRSFDEAARLLPSQYGYEDDIFYAKLASKELLTLEWLKTEHVAKKIVILVDVSGSMEDRGKYIVANAAVYKVAELAAATGVNEAIVVPFDDKPHEPIKMPPRKLMKFLTETMMYSGGGTDIDEALRFAVEELGATDVLIITDGQDNIEYRPPANVNVRVITFTNEGNETLREIAKEYIELDPEDLLS